MSLPNEKITPIPNDEPDAVPSLWNLRYEEIDANFGSLDQRQTAAEQTLTQAKGDKASLPARLDSIQQDIEGIRGEDPIVMSEKIDVLVEHGAQQIFTEHRDRVASTAITSAVAGDDSMDVESTADLVVGQHYLIASDGSSQIVRIREVLSSTRVTLEETLPSNVPAGAVLSRISGSEYVTTDLDGALVGYGGMIFVVGTATRVRAWIGGIWEDLVERRGGWEVPVGVRRFRVTGAVDRFALISALPISALRRPGNVSPSDGQPGLTTQPTLTGADYYALYAVPQKRRTFRVYDQAGAMIYEATETPSSGVPAVSHTVTSGTLSIESGYTWNYQDVNELGEEGAWSERTSFTTASVYIAAPSIIAPTDGETEVQETPTIEASAFAVEPGTESDTHTRSACRVRDADGNVLWSTQTSSYLTSIQVPAGIMEEGGKTYVIDAQHEGELYGWSAWSAAVTVTTAQRFAADVGEAGTQGFGVGIYPDTLPTGFTALSGHDDPASANYGNYQYSDGSVMVFVPAFYYRFGHADSPRFADYGANALDIVGMGAFADQDAAALEGYALHRAFIDGGAVKQGFFIDKYLNSKSAGNDAGVSVKGGVPISLTTSSSYTRSDGMTGCEGQLSDAIVLSRARGAGFNCASVFMYSALALLAMAHGQSATSTTYCAWYDGTGTTNYPKGCNSSLADVDDAGVTFESAGDSGTADKPKAGSGTPFAKTTHNGQACGVADVNGSMLQPALGITTPGSSGTSTTAVSNGDCYVLKETVALADLTAGFGGATDAWGDATALANNYDAQAGILPWGATTGAASFGNGANQVFSSDPDGQGWLRTACGIPASTDSISTEGTNLFGQDYCYQYNRENLFVRCAGSWGAASDAGVFYRTWHSSRSDSYHYYGFRAAAYGS